ncbi:MAG: hypothetical protein J0I07_08960, partial [Myxococcales bacterium]|nr:hypothetical protein [Myxococcales bacterium]
LDPRSPLGCEKPAELDAHQVEAGSIEPACAAQQEQSMVYLRLIWLVPVSVEKIPIARERTRRRELVTFRRIQVGQCLLECE